MSTQWPDPYPSPEPEPEQTPDPSEVWKIDPGDKLIMLPPTVDVDALVREYAAKIEDIISRGTDGDYTWLGLLSEFTRKLRGAQW